MIPEDGNENLVFLKGDDCYEFILTKYRKWSIKSRDTYYNSHSKGCITHLTSALISKTGKNTLHLSILNEVGRAGGQNLESVDIKVEYNF